MKYQWYGTSFQCYGTSFQCYGIRFRCYAMMLVENDMPELSVMKRSRSQYEKRFIHNFQIEKYLSNSIFLAGVIICELAHSIFILCRKNRVDNGRSFWLFRGGDVRLGNSKWQCLLWNAFNRMKIVTG